MVITESKLISVIKETVRNVLNESNMGVLYHFTDISHLADILNSNKLYACSTQSNLRNGKNYISLTRHKSAIEGFEGANSCNVRITLDADALRQHHPNGSRFRPFEFYKPEASTDDWGWSDNRSAKEKHRDYRYRKNYEMGDFEYYNQAEESLETNSKYIENISRYIISIDVCCDFDSYKKSSAKMLIKPIVDAFNCLQGNPMLNRIRVYTTYWGFNHQKGESYSPKDFLKRFGKKVTMEPETEEEQMRREENMAWETIKTKQRRFNSRKGTL